RPPGIHGEQCHALPGAGKPQIGGMFPAVRAPEACGMNTDQTSRNKHLVESFIQELFTKGDLTAVDRYLSPDFVNHDPPFPGSPDGPEGMRQAAVTMRAAAPDWRSELDQFVAEGDVVVEQFTAHGTHQGELMGVPGTGAALTMRGINVFRIVD